MLRIISLIKRLLKALNKYLLFPYLNLCLNYVIFSRCGNKRVGQ